MCISIYMTKRNYTNKMPYKGKFQPTDTAKYKGNLRNILYRSMWERQCMVYFDRNVNVIEWSSEEIIIPYVSPFDGKVHRYYPDFLVKVKQGLDIKTFVIEIKPSKFLKPPNRTRKKTKSYLYEVREWGRNSAKWKAAEHFCEQKEWTFAVWTEKTLGL